MFHNVTRRLRDIDWVLVAAILVLLGIGLGAIHFATLNDAFDHKNVGKQAISMGIGLGMMVLVTFTDYRNLSRHSLIAYCVTVVLLVLVLKMGHSVNGAVRWLKFGPVQVQPSEIAKLVTILVVGNFLVRVGEKIRELPVLLRSLALVGLPMLLIIKQPDLGTGLVVGAIWLGMTFLAGAKPLHLGAILVIGLAVFSLAWRLDTREVFLKKYQRDRVIALFNPQSDPRGKGYQVKQGIIAVGAGQVTGQGLGQGLQTNSKHVPENDTDFVFSVIGEESGFVGCVGLMALYGVLLWRMLVVILESEDYLGKLIAGGVATLFGFHVLVNIAMNTAAGPVVGVPLPLISYGGTAAITNLAAIGLLMAARLGRRKIEFNA